MREGSSPDVRRTNCYWRGLPFSAWLYRIAANEIASYGRSAHYHPQSLEALYEDHHFEVPADINLERELIVRQTQAEQYRDFRLVRELMKQLPERYQEVLALRYFEKKPLQEIALITGKRLGTIKSLLSRGTDRLRQAYVQEEQRRQLQPSGRSAVIKTEE